VDITEVRVKLVEGGQDKLRAFCSITIDDAFVVRDLKVIEGSKGLFVAMPSRKLTSRCGRCGFKNQLRSNYCNDCGKSLPESSPREDSRAKIHADIAHPIHSECRERLQMTVVESYLEEVEASEQPGYAPRDIEEFDAEPVAIGAGPPREEDRSPKRSTDDSEPSRRPMATERGPVPDADSWNAPDSPSEPREFSRSGPRESGRREGRTAAAEGRAVAEGRSPQDPQREQRNERRLTGRQRGPLSEMPPPDDNFSAGIF